MSSLILTIAFDFMLAILLMATIGYCSKLSRRIRLLQDSRGELASMISQFNSATERATTSLAELQTVSKKITDGLQLKIEKANFLADDLAFLIEKSTKLAAQLEQVKSLQAEMVAAHAKHTAEPKSFFNAEISAGKPKPVTEPLHLHTTPSSDTLPFVSKSATSLEAVLKRLASGPTSTDVPVATPSNPSQPKQQNVPRTSAERELIDALKSGR